MKRATPQDFAGATELVAPWRRPLIVSHTKPDGDAIGALLALRSMLATRGAQPLALIFEPLPDRYLPLQGSSPLSVLGAGVTQADLADVDGVIVVDTCSYGQLEPIADWLKASSKPKLAIDHHVTRDELADRYLIDESAAAACLILYDWFNAATWAMNETVRDALFLGIATDTGWFRHPNTCARAFSAAAGLVAAGAVPYDAFAVLYQSDSAARVRLLSAALDSLELHEDDRLAVMTLPTQAFAQTGAASSDTEDFINCALAVGSVRVAVLLVGQPDGSVRASFRSKPSHRATDGAKGTGSPDVDVSALAQSMGGGGHRRAAGARLAGPMDRARQEIVDRVGLVLAAG